MAHKVDRIVESDYGRNSRNFHVAKLGPELHVTLTYPPRTDADNKDNQCRFVVVEQESVRNADGLRLWFDFKRNGWVVEQNAPTMDAFDGGHRHTDHWQEVFFAPAWGSTAPEYFDDPPANSANESS